MISFIEILLIAGLSVLVALYMSAPVGITFLLIIVAGVLFSLFVTLAIKGFRAVTVKAETNSPALYKGETAALSITVTNKTIIPVPDVKVMLLSGGLMPDEVNTVRFSIGGRRSHTYEMPFTAKRWGIHKIGIERYYIGDFLGIFSFPENFEKFFHINVFPNIPEIPADDPVFLRAIYSTDNDNETEAEEEKTDFYGGFPGYNHREYVPGDPIRRINYKLSAKKGTLLIRLDDQTETLHQPIILEHFRGNASPDMEEEAVETVLGYAKAFTDFGLAADVYIFDEGGYKKHECNEFADIKALQSELVSYAFSDEESPLPIISSRNALVISPYKPTEIYEIF
jgi:uncharacterized protein (DUF58 family)